MNDSSTIGKDNSTWVTLKISAPPDTLLDILKNTERLFRLNPYLDIKKWEEPLDGQKFHFEALNEMNGITYNLEIEREVQLDRRYFLRYSQGLKAALEVTIQATSDLSKSVLTLREHYHQAAPAQPEQLKEIDHSLISWGNSIRAYVQGMRRWGWFWPYRWCREKLWLGMRPTHRRIARMLIWVTLLEFVVFLFVLVIYGIERAR